MSKNHRIDVARDDEAFGTDTAVYSDTDANIEAAGAEFDYLPCSIAFCGSAAPLLIRRPA